MNKENGKMEDKSATSPRSAEQKKFVSEAGDGPAHVGVFERGFVG